MYFQGRAYGRETSDFDFDQRPLLKRAHQLGAMQRLAGVKKCPPSVGTAGKVVESDERRELLHATLARHSRINRFVHKLCGITVYSVIQDNALFVHVARTTPAG